LAAERDLKSVAFPAISTGIYGYPLPEAAAIAIHEIGTFLEGAVPVEDVQIILFGHEAYEIFRQALQDAFGGSQAA
jgi:O-acetyl-ADP-ribose deacetylase (regulator of RNase III)